MHPNPAVASPQRTALICISSTFSDRMLSCPKTLYAGWNDSGYQCHEPLFIVAGVHVGGRWESMLWACVPSSLLMNVTPRTTGRRKVKGTNLPLSKSMVISTSIYLLPQIR
ncbi:hypothetical protein SCLCIDRAFT_913814 [Scleroderma citrinum Foug A]|uniref:Uncharacterized protein n=1 Tax=Scleroderma citrinum Foug A TaxID=1036808 RepID=A0A0C3A8U0_9AGAM|nr:hypothetical protein SCLCIDRAFT_913814 [Scleroderma citrinum Foug A]